MTSDQLLDGYITRAELATKLGVSSRTIHTYENQPNGLPSLTMAKKKLYKIASVAKWIEAREKVNNPRRKSA